MSPVGIVSIAVGVVALCVRIPTVVKPAASLLWLRRIAGTNGRMRVVGAFMATLGATMVWAGSTDDSPLATFLSVFGWAWLAVFIPAGVLFPAAFRALVNSKLFSAVGADPALMRMRGLLGVLVGVLLIYFGVRAL